MGLGRDRIEEGMEWLVVSVGIYMYGPIARVGLFMFLWGAQ